jgi:hypothetical protein
LVPLERNNESSQVIIPSPSSKINPLIDLNEISKELQRTQTETSVGYSPKKHYRMSNQQSIRLDSPDVPTKSPNLRAARIDPLFENAIKPLEKLSGPIGQTTSVGSLSNQDIIFLFGSFDIISEQLQQDLILYMRQLEETDPERYQQLQNVRLESSVEVELPDSFRGTDSKLNVDKPSYIRKKKMNR